MYETLNTKCGEGGFHTRTDTRRRYEDGYERLRSLGKGRVAELCLNLTYLHSNCSKLLCVSSDSIVAKRSRASINMAGAEDGRKHGGGGGGDRKRRRAKYLPHVCVSSLSFRCTTTFPNLTQRQLEAKRNFLDCHFIVLVRM
jgi:hypothetical protein